MSRAGIMNHFKCGMSLLHRCLSYYTAVSHKYRGLLNEGVKMFTGSLQNNFQG